MICLHQARRPCDYCWSAQESLLQDTRLPLPQPPPPPGRSSYLSAGHHHQTEAGVAHDICLAHSCGGTESAVHQCAAAECPNRQARCASASLNCAHRCFLKHRTCVLCPLLSSSTHFQRISRVFLFTSAFVAGWAFQLLHVPERFVLLLMSIISKIRTNDPSSNHEVLAHQKTHRNHLISVTE